MMPKASASISASESMVTSTSLLTLISAFGWIEAMRAGLTSVTAATTPFKAA